MLGVHGFFIVAAVLYISDADPTPTPRFKELITTAIQSIDETVRLLPDAFLNARRASVFYRRQCATHFGCSSSADPKIESAHHNCHSIS
ncbi:hypothetical protein Q1695_004341 [Nippostrongylus brasiliensis]|nr:hypothetical protein Q1695_004341 [Nippostrongylus brasiliensis]